MLPGLSAPSLAQVFPLLGGDWGTAQTVSRIRTLVNSGKKSINVNRTAIGIVWNTPNFSETEKAEAIFDWVKANTRFINDVTGTQTVRSADEILKTGGGNCANLNAVLIPSLLETIGIPARLVTIAHDPETPGDFSHVYAEAYVDGQWVPMDVARPGAEFGLAPEESFREPKVWALDPPAAGSVGRLGSYLLRGRGLGFDWSQLPSDLAAGANAAATINNSLNAPTPYYNYGPPPTGYAYAAPGGTSLVATTSGIPGWAWVVILGLGVFLVAKR